MAAGACCFAIDGRLRPLRKVGHGQWCNEAETGSRFRIAADVFADTGTPPVGLPLPMPGQLHVKQAIYMANSFQSASYAKLRLAYQRAEGRGQRAMRYERYGEKRDDYAQGFFGQA